MHARALSCEQRPKCTTGGDVGLGLVTLASRQGHGFLNRSYSVETMSYVVFQKVG